MKSLPVGFSITKKGNKMPKDTAPINQEEAKEEEKKKKKPAPPKEDVKTPASGIKIETIEIHEETEEDKPASPSEETKVNPQESEEVDEPEEMTDASKEAGNDHSAEPEENVEVVEIGAEKNQETTSDLTGLDEPKPKKSFNFKILLIPLILILIGGAIYGGILISQKALKKAELPEESIPNAVVPEEESIVSPTETPTSTPTPPDRADLSLQILNGSGAPGLAGKVKTLLEDLGYENIETGNAASYDYEETKISLKEASSTYFELLSTDLAGDYVVSSQSGLLKDTSDYDAVITLGSKTP